SADQKILGNCPKCEDGKVFESKKAWGCSNWKEKECKFAIWKELAGKTITEKQVETLFKKGITSVIKGFKSKSGNPFNAALKIHEGAVVFDFQKEAIGTCPLCQGDIVETAKAFSCDNWKTTGCKFAIWKEIAKRKMKKDEAIKLIKDGKLEKVEGFKSKAGKPFSADLVLSGERVEMKFN
ncbi:DNA topoisomerase III, partial [Candidatus Marinamargulisbacteria bacterium SCGC AAA071-K20]